jgi:hypothetical protein
MTDAIEPFHDRVREAIALALDEGTRRLRHEQLALALEAWDRGEIEPLAVHWRAAGEPVKAAAYAFEAAEQAARALAFDRAARLYEMALELHPPVGEKARAMYLQLANALAYAGRGPEAAHAYNVAAEGATAAETLERRRLAAEQLLRAGHVDEGVTAIRAVLSLVGMSYPESRRKALLSIARRRAWLKLRGLGFRERDKSQITAAELTRIDACWSVAAGLGLVDTVRHFDFQNRHLQLALRAGELTRVIRALCMEMVWAAVNGNDRRVAALCDRINPLVARAGDPFSRALLIGCRGIAQTMLGNFREARALLSEAERLLRTQCLNVYSEIATIRHFLAAGYGLTGIDTREVLAHLNEARTRGDRHGVASLRSPLVYKMLMDDQPEGARRWCLEVLADWSRVGYQLQQFSHLHTMTTIDMYEGKWQDALQNLEANRTNVRRSGLLKAEQVGVWWKLLWGRSALQGACAVEGPQRDELFAIVRRSIRGLRHVARPYTDGLAELLEAGLLHARGEECIAVDRLRQLDVRFEALGLTAYNGAVQYRLSVLCADAEERQHWERRWPETLARNVVRPERLFETTSPGFVRR